MAGIVGFTEAELRELVHEYEIQPYGRKRRWLEERGVSYSRFRLWRAGGVRG